MAVTHSVCYKILLAHNTQYMGHLRPTPTAQLSQYLAFHATDSHNTQSVYIPTN